MRLRGVEARQWGIRIGHRDTMLTSQILSSLPGRPEREYYELQAHPQPATWTWHPSATGPLPWDSEPQPFGAGPPETP